MHAHLCLAPVRRLCACVICRCGTCYVSCRRSCLVFIVSKLQWPCHAIVPNLHLHLQRTPSSIHLSEGVRLCDTHMAVLPMVCNNIPRDIPERDPPRMYARTYVHTYFVKNRSSIQSLALMRSAIMLMHPNVVSICEKLADFET